MGILFYIIGTLISIGGFIGGITFGIKTENFALCLLVWFSTFFEAIIYFGIGYLFFAIDETKKSMEFQTRNTEFITRRENSKSASAGEWKCPKCGAINQNYVGTCGCGELKPK